MTGQVVSHYKILEKLGEGGMGVVYKAEDLKLDRPVALKFLPSHLLTSEQDKARFIQEAKSASAINHPNVATIYEIDEADGKMFIAMEFVDGVTLREKMRSASFKQAIDIGIQIADGLATAHEKGIIHRDIKPENIMVRKDGICQIMDFGLAKLRGNNSKISRLTKEGSTIGTAGYMSPEQVQGQDVDHRSDIFSFGVLLYELFTGSLPFKGMHETALLYEIVNVDAVPMNSVKPEIEPALDNIVLECLAKEPSERYQSVAEIAKELRRFKRDSTRHRATRTTAVRSYPSRETGSDTPQSALSRYPVKFLWQSVSVILGAAVVVLALRPWGERAGPVPSPVMRFPVNLAITSSLIGGAATLAISPDGKNIVYLALVDGTPQLHLRPMNEFEGHPMAGTQNANDPFFSADGEWIGFFSGGKLKKISIFGGTPQEVCDVGGVLRGGWWAEDNTIWYGHINRAVHKVAASGGTPTEVTVLDSSAKEISHRFPQALPGGKGLLLTVKKSNISSFDEAEIAVEVLSTHERKTIIHGGSYARYVSTGHILYARGSAIYAVPFDLEKLEVRGSPLPVIEGGMLSPESGDANYCVSQNGTLVYLPLGSRHSFQVKLEWLDRRGKATPLLDSLRQYGDGTLSPDGQKLAMTIRAANDDIWVYNLKRGTMSRLTFGGGNSDGPIWTPDGSKVLYVSERGRSYSLFGKAWDGSGAEEKFGALDDVDPASPPSISPDGKSVAYARAGDIWILSPGEEGKSSPFIVSPAQESDPAFSPNGKWLAYTSDESGRKEVCVVPFPKQQGKWQISTKGGEFARWLGSGKEIIFLDGTTIMSIDVQSLPGFDFGVPKKLFSLPTFTGFFDPSRDGSRFVFGELQGQSAKLTQVNVVVGWFEELKTKFSNSSSGK